jgi:enolase-phosphatase E1
MNPRVVLLDIEGTTTPISFVFDTLFPYAREHGPAFIREHVGDIEISGALEQLRRENMTDRLEGAPEINANGGKGAVEQTIEYYLWLMDRDRKSTPLKAIQGRIWEEGYGRGELQSVVFPDVAPALRRWQEEGRVIAIYSSGSVLAQQQLFRYTTAGDLTPFIASYFDTRMGAKKEAQSYTRIAAKLNTDPEQMLFISDVIAELDAARMAGLATLLSMRPGNAVSEQPHTYRVIHSFDEVL